MGVRRKTAALDVGLAAVVVLHLAIAVVHGAAHAGAVVPLSALGNAFVLVVIIAGPLAGLLVWALFDARAGAWIIAATLGASFAFGFINHFLIAGADHVAHVAGPWREMFGATAILLAIAEALGSGMAVWSAVRTGRST
jgi:hypothetical protein